MKYILFATMLSFALTFMLINCARAKYRHPTDPHVSATVVRNSDADYAHYSDFAERAYVAQIMQYADSIADAKHEAVVCALRNVGAKQYAQHDAQQYAQHATQTDTMCAMAAPAAHDAAHLEPDTSFHH
jgi:hypothetical protein